MGWHEVAAPTKGIVSRERTSINGKFHLVNSMNYNQVIQSSQFVSPWRWPEFRHVHPWAIFFKRGSQEDAVIAAGRESTGSMRLPLLCAGGAAPSPSSSTQVEQAFAFSRPFSSPSSSRSCRCCAAAGHDLPPLHSATTASQAPLLPRSHQFRPDLRSTTSRQGFRRLTRMNVWGWTWTRC